MRIQVDAEAKKVIESLCDVAVRSAGLQNLPVVNNVMATMKILPVNLLADSEKKPDLKLGKGK